MCGFTGFVDLKSSLDQAVLGRMVKSLEHRGPDASGEYWLQKDTYQIGLGHARLSILDLSSGANQPMVFEDYVIIYNGEVYNFKEIKSKLAIEGVTFKTDSDTEVILKSFLQWGKACVEHFVGMFAFVIYDQKSDVLHACRDRAGVKPFFWFYDGNCLAFGSELKALMANPLVKKDIDINSMGMYFRYGYVPSPHAIFKDTFKLNPGSWLEVKIDQGKMSQTKSIYWSVKNCYEQSKFEGDYNQAKVKAKNLLSSAAEYRMVADVPVGVFLSGGYDSTAVTALLQQSRSTKIKTFTIGFNQGNDESMHARKVAEFLGTEHNELICTEEDAKDLVGLLPFHFDEPNSDSSAIPTMLVSKFAREQVSVALSADAGDELFAGYSRYKSYLRHLEKVKAGSSGIDGIFQGAYALAKPLFGYKYKQALLKKLSVAAASGRILSAQEQSLFVFREMNSAPQSYLHGLLPNYSNDSDSGFNITGSFKSNLDLALANDYWMYLQNDILTKVDRATMAYSLEGREPLLDHRLIEFAARLPDDHKMQAGIQKRLLKDIVHDLVPKEIMDRPKSGFSVPLNEWLRGDLSYLIEEYLSEDIIDKSLFNYDFVKYLKDRHRKGKLYFSLMLWRLLTWQMWAKQWL